MNSTKSSNSSQESLYDDIPSVEVARWTFNRKEDENVRVPSLTLCIIRFLFISQDDVSFLLHLTLLDDENVSIIVGALLLVSHLRRTRESAFC